MTLRRIALDSPIGRLHLVASAEGLVEVQLPGSERGRHRDVPIDERPHRDLDRARAQLHEYFAGERASFDLRLDPAGTEFQRAVWSALVEIPFGETSTYAAIAAKIGRAAAVRAVGAANGSNPLAIIVPCHRVIGSDGSLTGFAGGLDRKRWLLDHERANARRGDEPVTLDGRCEHLGAA